EQNARTPYERLLDDAMDGDQQLFAREDAVLAEWRIVDAILDDKAPVARYARGTWGPSEAASVYPDALVPTQK
ncbi:MAG TPA: glucose-6-phosphate dehydrogenase, partial [Myxococcota bacterium]